MSNQELSTASRAGPIKMAGAETPPLIAPRSARVELPTLDEVEAAIEACEGELKRLRKIRRFLIAMDVAE